MNVEEFRQDGRRVVDVFPFFNELELLELRLTMLTPYVDNFVIVECEQTFSGGEKPLYFSNNRQMFNKWRHKITLHIVDNPLQNRRDLRARLSTVGDSSLDQWILKETASSPLTAGSFHWKQEFFQKESARKALIGLDDRDVVFYGDLDEIWNPQMTFDWNEQLIYRLKQSVYMYWLNNRSSEVWQSAFFAPYRTVRNQLLNDLRAGRSINEYRYVDSGGWHFTFQGGEERIRRKIEAYGHQEFNNKRIKSRVMERLKKNQDIFGRDHKFVRDENDLPPELKEFRQKFPDWFA